MRNFLFYLFCAAVLLILIKANEKYAGRARFDLDDISLPACVKPIPGEERNYRSAQLNPAQLDSVLSAGLIRTVIRLNGDGKDAAGTSIAREREYCEAYNVRFLMINPHAAGAAQIIHDMLTSGRVLIHCRHGFDRTGAMVGYHLRRLGYTREQVIQHNGWQDYEGRKGKKYVKYLAFLQ